MSCAVVAAGFGLLLSAGCGKAKEEPATADPSSSPASYMNDEKFLGTLEEVRGERQELATRRAKVVAAMKAMVDAKRAAMKGADDAAVKAALEKDAEWTSLAKRLADLNVAMKESRQKAMGVVRERIAPKRAGRSGEDTASPLGGRSGEDTASPLKKNLK